jgi:hypothetical protein
MEKGQLVVTMLCSTLFVPNKPLAQSAKAQFSVGAGITGDSIWHGSGLGNAYLQPSLNVTKESFSPIIRGTAELSRKGAQNAVRTVTLTSEKYKGDFTNDSLDANRERVLSSDCSCRSEVHIRAFEANIGYNGDPIRLC